MHRFVARGRAVALAVVLSACSGSGGQPRDAAVDAPVDAPVDAAPDAPPDAAVAPTTLDLTGGGRLTGGTLTVDLQVGHPTARAPTSGGSITLTPATPIAP